MDAGGGCIEQDADALALDQRLEQVGGGRIELALHQPVHQVQQRHGAPAFARPYAASSPSRPPPTTTTRVVVVGGGLLGLEAAYGLAKAGAPVTLLHLMDRLMERQLDPPAADLLKSLVEPKGIKVLLNADTARIHGESRSKASS